MTDEAVAMLHLGQYFGGNGSAAGYVAQELGDFVHGIGAAVGEKKDYSFFTS